MARDPSPMRICSGSWPKPRQRLRSRDHVSERPTRRSCIEQQESLLRTRLGLGQDREDRALKAAGDVDIPRRIDEDIHLAAYAELGQIDPRLDREAGAR